VVTLGEELPAGAGGKNLAVAEDGTYDLLLNPDAAVYKIIKSGTDPNAGGGSGGGETFTARITVDGDISDWEGDDVYSFAGDDNRFKGWKATSDAKYIYMLYNINASKIKFDSSGDGYAWKSYIYIGFDLDNDASTGDQGENGGAGNDGGLEALGLVFPWRGTVEGSPEFFSGADTQGKIECPVGTVVEGAYVNVAGKMDGEIAYIEVSIERAYIGSPATGSTIVINNAMNYYPSGRESIVLN